MPTDLKSLLPFRPERRHPTVRLICFPFAGGGATIFRSWGAALPDHVDVCAVELPGRGMRFGEPPIESREQLADELSALTKLNDLPVVYFGHSLGARIVFALVRSGARADAVIMSGSRPPHLKQPIRSTLPREVLVRELRQLGGTPREILDDEDMLNLILPILRADFRLVEQLSVSAEESIDCPMTVLAASDDVEVPISMAEQWKMLASGEFRFRSVDGGHFFVVSRAETVLAAVRSVLAEALAG